MHDMIASYINTSEYYYTSIQLLLFVDPSNLRIEFCTAPCCTTVQDSDRMM